MRRENEKLIIDGNAIYELDLECVRKKQGKQEGNGDCCWIIIILLLLCGGWGNGCGC